MTTLKKIRDFCTRYKLFEFCVLIIIGIYLVWINAVTELILIHNEKLDILLNLINSNAAEIHP